MLTPLRRATIRPSESRARSAAPALAGRIGRPSADAAEVWRPPHPLLDTPPVGPRDRMTPWRSRANAYTRLRPTPQRTRACLAPLRTARRELAALLFHLLSTLDRVTIRPTESRARFTAPALAVRIDRSTADVAVTDPAVGGWGPSPPTLRDRPQFSLTTLRRHRRSRAARNTTAVASDPTSAVSPPTLRS